MIKIIVFIALNLFLSYQLVFSHKEIVSLNKSGNIEFIENRGQFVDSEGNVSSEIRFVCFIANQAIQFGNTGVTFCFSKFESSNENLNSNPFDMNSINKVKRSISYSEMNFVDANTKVTVFAEEKLPTYNNYYLQHCPDGIVNVPVYGKITYKNLYEKIDLVFYENNGELEYDFIVYPGADPKEIKMELTGFLEHHINNNGDLILKNDLGTVLQTNPNSFQSEKVIKSSFILDGNISTFNIGSHNSQEKLIIDPQIRIWGTYFGDVGQDYCKGIDKDKLGNIYITGAYTNQGNKDICTIKFSSDGVLQWRTIIGGSAEDVPQDIVVDKSNVYISGTSWSDNLIATDGVYQKNRYGNMDTFLMKIDDMGYRQWGTYFGGEWDDCSNWLCVDSSGFIIISGITASKQNIASSTAHQNNFGGNTTDGYLAKFDTTGNLEWSTYYGGSGNDRIFGVAVDKSNYIFTTGVTESNNAISTNDAYQKTFAGDHDCYLAKFNSSGKRLKSTYFGGIGKDMGWDLKIDNSNNILIVGSSSSNFNMTTQNAYQEYNNGGEKWGDSFLAKFDDNLDIIWCTYFGGKEDEHAYGISIDNMNNIFFTGDTKSSESISYNNDYQEHLSGESDAFIANFSENGDLFWGTYLGGDNVDTGHDILSDNGSVYIVGSTTSSNNISTKNSYQEYYSGIRDGFIVKLSLGGCDETSFNFNSFKQITNLNLVKDARLTDSTITLTPADYWKGGAIWYRDKIPVKKGFTTDFSFRFSDGEDKFTEEEYPGADGITFVIQNQSNDVIGTLGGGGGYKKISNSLAVEYDTYYNNDDDSEYEDFNDPNENHIAVFCNGTETNTCDHYSKAHLGTTAIMPIVPKGRIYYSRIEYDYKQNELRVYLDTIAEFVSHPVLVISNIDLSQMLDLDSEEYAWVGFTSATGNAFERHELLSWDFCSAPTSAIIIDVEELKPLEIRNLNLNVYPNPATDAVNIEYFIENIASVSLKVYDVLGNEVMTLKDGINEQGKLNIKWETKGIQSGIYYLIIDNGINIVSQRIVLIK